MRTEGSPRRSPKKSPRKFPKKSTIIQDRNIPQISLNQTSNNATDIDISMSGLKNLKKGKNSKTIT
jgi:hypothetical protein